LLDAVDAVKDIVQEHADESEELGDLAPPAVQALEDVGLFALKLPAELGGAEADPVTQLEVIERMAYNDPSAGWATMIGATSIGWVGAFFPEETMGQIFANGRIPGAAGIGGVSGSAVPVEGGYKLTGTFAFASGLPHSDWLIASARIVRDDAEAVQEGAPPEVRTFVRSPGSRAAAATRSRPTSSSCRRRSPATASSSRRAGRNAVGRFSRSACLGSRPTSTPRSCSAARVAPST
jgi:alkylation response protein AidB-like acyl-CoA dehydrogenase